MPRPRKTRDDYVVFRPVTTRWRDNDVYGHVNNVVYYEYVDSAVNGWLAETGTLAVPGAPVIGLVVETACVFHESVAFPEALETGLKVTRIGTSSVQYEVGIFRADGDAAVAEARFTHVYVDREARRPVAMSEPMRGALKALQPG